VSLLLLVEDLEFTAEGLDLVLLRLDGLVIIDAVELTLGDEDASFDVLQFHLLLLDFEALLADDLVLLLYLGEVDAIVLLLGLVTH
jgi:hypothetical protein